MRSTGSGDEPRNLGPRTRAIHGGMRVRPRDDWAGVPLALPLVQSSTYAFSTPEEMIEVLDGVRPGYIYTRYDNPTVAAVEEKLAALEGGEWAILFSSGLAALHAALAPIGRRGKLIAGRDLYGGTTDLLEQMAESSGLAVERIDLSDPSAWEDSLNAGATALLFETPTNPLLKIIDAPALVAKAKAAGVMVIVDNTFATPVLQSPLDWGADLVVHSATKYLGGHSDLTLGVIIGREAERRVHETCRRIFGAAPDPFAAWLLNRGLPTLDLRVRAQSASAAAIAAGLSAEPQVSAIHYPGIESHPGHEIARRQMTGFGGMLAIEIKGGREAAMRFLGGLSLIRLATSLGGVETIISRPASSSHRMLSAEAMAEAGIGEGLVRLSAGLENVEDLLRDLRRALERMRQGRG